MALTEDQLAKLAARTKNKGNYPAPPASRDWTNIFDIQHEEILAGMFGRRYEDDEQFPAGLTYLKSTLFAPKIGRRIKPDELPALLSLATKVTHPELIVRCLYSLEQVIEDGLPENYRLAEDTVRVLAELKAKLPDVVKGREESRKIHAGSFKELAEMAARQKVANAS
jgi:hypothetical protein